MVGSRNYFGAILSGLKPQAPSRSTELNEYWVILVLRAFGWMLKSESPSPNLHSRLPILCWKSQEAKER